jgi:XRE family transcriptional regulator, regulator of sulfur utilization
MPLSRRDLGLLLPALAAMNAQGQQSPALASKVYHNGQLAYQGDDKKKGRRFFYGKNHIGFNLEMHETILGPGTATHAPHKHEHEEIVIVMDGKVESYLDGVTEVAEPGSVFYYGSNQMHSARNAGTVPCRYLVLELRGNEA